MPLKRAIISLLKELAGYMELNGENKFKIRAYKNASSSLQEIDQDIEDLIEKDELKDVKGVGKGILFVINEYYNTGKSEYLEELRNNIPPGLLKVMEVKGVGAQKAKLLYEELNISDLETLETACRNNSLASLKGFGEKTQLKVLDDIERMKRNIGYHLLHKGLTKGEAMLANLLKNKWVKQAELTGELRRKLEVISKIEILILREQSEKFTKYISEKYQIILHTANDIYERFLLDDQSDFEIIFYVVDEKEQYERALFLSTGSEEFLEKYKDEISDAPEKMGAGYIIPAMREQDYWKAKAHLVTNSDLDLSKFKGMLHFHTNFSDGLNSVKEMVEAGKEFNYQYFAVCDHSKAAFYANGLKEERVAEQKSLIKQLKKDFDLKIFHGIECDILGDGNLDYDDDYLNNFEFVVASIHSRFNQSENEMTARIIKAVENPNTDVLAHPTGRLLLTRDGYNVNIEKVLQACAQNDVAIEINANPHRLDLDWRKLYRARDLGCKISINADAHSKKEIDNVKYGVMMARKGGVQTSEVINCYDFDSFKKFINRKKKRF